MQIKEFIERLKGFDENLQLAVLTMEIDDPHVSSEILLSIESKQEWATSDLRLASKFVLIR